MDVRDLFRVLPVISLSRVLATFRSYAPRSPIYNSCQRSHPVSRKQDYRSIPDIAPFREGRSTLKNAVAIVALCIAGRRELGEIGSVKTTAKRRTKSEAELLEHATDNLARALKRDMLKKDGRIDYDKLRKEGYSERLLAKLEQA